MTHHGSHITIAVDAMGGDYAPGHVVSGALEAVGEGGGRFSLILVGSERRIGEELTKHPGSLAAGPASPVSVYNASQTIDMRDSPTAALKSKKDSSIGVGLHLHRDGKAQAFVSAGNTGAVLSASTLILGRIKGVGRPTIGALIPTVKGRSLLIDAGANVECRPRHLLEFAVMGSIYVSSMLGTAQPTVGLLNVGEEEGKGNDVVREAHRLLQQSSLHFVGNVEGRDLLKGDVDVIVCDGFIGNILLKFGESVPAFLKGKFTAFASHSPVNKLLGLVARKGLRTVMKELDYQEHGGVPLLGVNGVSIIGHGGSTPKAIKNMILRAEEMVRRNVNQQIQDALLQYA